MRTQFTTLAITLLLSTQVFAQDDSVGSVSLPLEQYQALTQSSGSPQSGPTHAFSNVRVNVSVSEEGGTTRAQVNVSARVRTFREDGWTLVPLASAGALSGATVGGASAPLIERGGLVAWPVEGAGTHEVTWSYHVDAARYESGWALALPTPGSGGQLSATFADMDVSPVVVPASGVSTTRNGGNTQVSASIPAGSGVQLFWRADAAGGYTLSRARYSGEVIGDSVRWTVALSVDLDGSGRALVPLFPSSVALESVVVDRSEAPIAVHDGRFAVPIRGRGRHRITATFLVPIHRDGGLPHVELDIAPTPVSRFELALPGEREVQVTPHAGVTSARRGETTLSSFNVPMSSHVSIRWAEAVPEDTEAIETRANANIIHIVRPDEGVLNLRALVAYEISRGTMRRAVLSLPEGVQVNSVESSGGVVGDWRVTGEGDERILTVFLDREVGGALELDVRYERSWPVATRTSETFAVPLLRAVEDEGVTRQRGMVALLSIRELTLEPRDTEHVTRVGDNALPAGVRDALEATVAHTYRYLDEEPELTARRLRSDPRHHSIKETSCKRSPDTKC